MRKTKIIATIGPASDSPEIIKSFIQAGVEVFRLNFSHGTQEYHANVFNLIREISNSLKKPVAILQDLQGPKLRVGTLAEEGITLSKGDEVLLKLAERSDSPRVIPIKEKELIDALRPNASVMLADGLIELKVIENREEGVLCKVINGGRLESRKGINVPNITINIPSVTSKDIDDIMFGIKLGVDFIAVSFVRKAADVLHVKNILEASRVNIPVIAKIEKHEAIENIDDIVLASDGVMVARGDLGVEIPLEEVPILQKSIIEKCNRLGKPVITATQMLDSMMRNPRPTRAEVSDVANAIFDGTDAIMLSGETAVGEYPLEAVLTMAKIAEYTESKLKYSDMLRKRAEFSTNSPTDAIGYATCEIAQRLGAKAIITSTQSGYTARMVAKYRPAQPIIAVTPDERVQRRLLLFWGINPLTTRIYTTTDEMIEASVQASLEAGFIRKGDTVILTGGIPVGIGGTTNFLKVHQV
ncbi:pyruvate kinase [bacterium]|nr:pyruvate kinase [bacterium]